jgi:pilus assembly protein CpaC
LGNGKIRLEVKPHISDLDPTRNYVVGDTTIPGILTREADTAVEMTAGQTMAIAGLLSSREDSENSGLPFISDVPYLGVPFRKVKSETNEIELLILVTPELVEPMDASEVPQCGPGLATTTPGDWDLYMKGHIEVPNCCPNDKNSPPSDGMIGPEAVPAPSGALTPENRPVSRNGSGASAQVARRTSVSGAQNRYSSSRPTRGSSDSRGNDLNSPPPFVGPVGYDVIK